MNLAARLAQTIAVFLSCLREIFDESAYARFLRLHRMPSSAHAYAEFCREQSGVKPFRPRCC
jgi:hypothetical protein